MPLPSNSIWPSAAMASAGVNQSLIPESDVVVPGVWYSKGPDLGYLNCPHSSVHLWILGVFTVVEIVSTANDVHVGVLQLGQAQWLEVVNFVNEA